MLQSGLMDWLDGRGSPPDALPVLRGSAVLSREGAEALFAGAPRTLDQAFAGAAAGQVRSFALPAAVQGRTRSRHAATTSPNVLAVPRLRPRPREGVRRLVRSPRSPGDRRRAGRRDDLQRRSRQRLRDGGADRDRARLCVPAGPSPPVDSLRRGDRGGEGAPGAEYFARNPTAARFRHRRQLQHGHVPGASTRPRTSSRSGPSTRAWGRWPGRWPAAGPHGRSRPVPRGGGLHPQRPLRLRSQGDSLPDAIRPGSGAPIRGAHGPKTFGHWLATVYHSPKDDASQPIDFDSAAKVARLYFLMADKVATDSARPAWNPGDFFGTKFGR